VAAIDTSGELLRYSRRGKEMNSISDRFVQDGFVVVRNVFSQAEIASLREKAYKQVDADAKEGLLDKRISNSICKIPLGDLLSKSNLRHILLDERILDVARTLLPQCPLVYFGDNTYQIGNAGSGFHRDNVNRETEGPDWLSSYTLLRMGIYLQEHSKHSVD
jgi:Phytanoyl-CoA dioxygenase (PhyH)